MSRALMRSQLSQIQGNSFQILYCLIFVKLSRLHFLLYEKAYFKKASTSVEHTLDRELRKLRKMSNRNASQPRDRPSQIDSQQTNIFKQLHTEKVKQKNPERRGGENTAVSNILLIKEYNDWPLLKSVDPLKWWRQRLGDGARHT